MGPIPAFLVQFTTAAQSLHGPIVALTWQNALREEGSLKSLILREGHRLHLSWNDVRLEILGARWRRVRPLLVHPNLRKIHLTRQQVKVHRLFLCRIITGQPVIKGLEKRLQKWVLSAPCREIKEDNEDRLIAVLFINFLAGGLAPLQTHFDQFCFTIDRVLRRRMEPHAQDLVVSARDAIRPGYFQSGLAGPRDLTQIDLPVVIGHMLFKARLDIVVGELLIRYYH